MGTGLMSTIDAQPAATLPAGTCHVWWARPGDADPAWAEILDAGERGRLDGLTRPGERQRFLAAHVLCRTVLAAYLGADPATLAFTDLCGACGGDHGKPRLDGGAVRLEFSIARAGDRVAVAVAHDPIGVDVEEFGRVSDTGLLSDMALRPAEFAVLDALPDERRPAAFLRYWTRKEAVLKALGVGRSVPPNRLHVSGPDDRPQLISCEIDPAPGAPVQLFDLTPGGGASACLAVLSDTPYHVDVMAGTPLLRR
jgi:4'-phosphopantetheinyl transferase